MDTTLQRVLCVQLGIFFSFYFFFFSLYSLSCPVGVGGVRLVKSKSVPDFSLWAVDNAKTQEISFPEKVGASYLKDLKWSKYYTKKRGWVFCVEKK